MTYEIEKNIPLPHGWTKAGVGKYPFATMAVGDSFLMPLAVRNSVSTYASRHNIKLVSRKISDTEARVWRVA